MLGAGRRAAVANLEEATASDDRPPVLFLRAFRYDKAKPRIRIKSLFQLIDVLSDPDLSFELMIAREGAAKGPVVAIGNPADTLPAYGAARGYVSDADWQPLVANLMGSSSLIVMMIDTTPGVAWELQTLTKMGLESKTLFVFPLGVPRSLGTPDRDHLFGMISAPVQQAIVGAVQAGVSENEIIALDFNGTESRVYIAKAPTRLCFDLVFRSFLRREIATRIA